MLPFVYISPPHPNTIFLFFHSQTNQSLYIAVCSFQSLVLINHNNTFQFTYQALEKMNRWGHQQKAFVGGGCVPNGVVCPKPRRISIPIHSREPIRINSQLGEGCDSRVGTELLDVILTKVSSSPPFFTGSPPNRASNPVIQDEQFRNDYGYPLSPKLQSPSSAQKIGGSVRVNFRPNIAPVRIEGFNCRRNSSIFAKA